MPHHAESPQTLSENIIHPGTEKYPHFLSAVCSCVHGVCNSGIDSNGTCECYSAYTGPNCDKREYHEFPQRHTRSAGHRRMHFRLGRPGPGPGVCCSAHPLLSPVPTKGFTGLATRGAGHPIFISHGWPLRPPRPQPLPEAHHTSERVSLSSWSQQLPQTPSEPWLLAPPCGWPSLEGRFLANLAMKASQHLLPIQWPWPCPFQGHLDLSPGQRRAYLEYLPQPEGSGCSLYFCYSFIL